MRTEWVAGIGTLLVAWAVVATALAWDYRRAMKDAWQAEQQFRRLFWQAIHPHRKEVRRAQEAGESSAVGAGPAAPTE